MAVTIRNAKRICWEGGENSDKNTCEHWSWEGTIGIIDTNNRIIIDSIDFKNAAVNWYSLKTINTTADTSIRINFRGVNGLYYSFIDYKKEFRQWFNKIFLKSYSNNIDRFIYKEVIIQEGRAGWVKSNNARFRRRYSKLLGNFLNRISEQELKVAINTEELNWLIFEGASFKQFYNSCGNHFKEKFPFVSLSVYLDKDFKVRKELDFIRTNDGYKLLTMQL